METQAIYQVAVSAPYTRGAFIGMLKNLGIRRNSHSWQDYEIGKQLIYSLESNEPEQTQYYDLYLSYLASWVQV